MMLSLLFFPFFAGFMVFFLNFKNLIINLLSLEFLMLMMFFLMFILLMKFNNEMFFCIMFMTFMVCEGVLGLSLLISMIRNYGTNQLNLMTNFKW